MTRRGKRQFRLLYLVTTMDYGGLLLVDLFKATAAQIKSPYLLKWGLQMGIIVRDSYLNLSFA